MKRGALLLILLVFSAITWAKAGPNGRAKNAIQAARNAKTDEERTALLKSITAEDVQDEEDLKALVGELKTFRAEPDRKKNSDHLAAIQQLSTAIKKTTKPGQHAAIKRLLDAEEADLPKNFQGPWGAKSKDEGFDAAARLERIQALVTAAADGRNEQALSTIRRIRKKGGVAGKIAEKAIGQFGKDEDFEQFVAEVKGDPKSLTDLNVFGPRAMRRIIEEVDSPSTTSEEKARLMGAFPRSVSRQDIPQVERLLKHDNKRVATIASNILANSLGSEDGSSIRGLLISSRSEERSAALSAMERSWKPAYVQDMINALRSDSDPAIRTFAAHVLGKKKVKEAESVLQEAATNDAVATVRETAAFALKKIKK